jgi:hypothetical protein
MHEKYKDEIAPVVAQRWATEIAAGSNVQTKKEPDGPFRAKISRELFAQLPEEERVAYGDRAKTEAAEAREKYMAGLKAPPSKAPEDRQAYVISL